MRIEPMKRVASVSLLAIALASCTTATAPPPPPIAVAESMPVAAAPGDTSFPLTPDGARQFVAMVEKDLYDLSVIGGRAAWVNATYITDDTDALAAYFGTIGTEKGVKYATEAAKYAAVPGLDFDTARKLNILRGALTLPAPSTPGAANELNTITTRLQSTYGGADRDLEDLARECRPADAQRLHAYGRDRQPGRQGARLRRHWHHVALPVRHEPARILGDVRSAVGGNQAALRPVALLHAD
jgi:peptidyl-dipeptidase A